MLDKFYYRKRNSYYPKFLYDLALDMFSIVQFWESPPVKGPQKGRIFEQIFYRYCEFKGVNLTEQAGSRKIQGVRSASGFQHENDGVIAAPDLTIHLELKYLSSELEKNELLIFNQKGIDFLMGENNTLRKKPLYRVILSGNLLTHEARSFALHWGILTIEPDRLPLLLIHRLSNLDIKGLARLNEKNQDKIWTIIPKLIVPVQDRINQLSKSFLNNGGLISLHQIDIALKKIQREWGDEFWIALDEMSEPNWLEERFEILNWELGLDGLFSDYL